MSPNILIYTLVVIDLGCAVAYGVSKDWARVAYWASAAVLTWSTTEMR